MSIGAAEPTGPVHSLGRRELLRVLDRGLGNTIVDEIIVRVGTDIIEGRLLPGDDLNSVELARNFGSSRTPVREALLTLEREGFVEISAHRRPRVAPLRIEEVRELYRVRAHLYALVSRELVEVASDDDLDRLQALQDELALAVALDDVDRYFWTNVDFRNTEAQITGNRTLCRVLDNLGLRMLQLRHVSLSLPGRLTASLADHDRLLRAYRDRDPDLAAALTSSLVIRGLSAIERSGWTGSGG
ncbi:GntR family transcriptional regulator [Pseudonocardia benzenivorans]|jgi:DNA-binding GntR family transcriptional regulator|uniref:Transcriptional regulator, GntR family n=2 Tax=Pseudonocardia TaxID=1847 RepID=F4CPZ1_PSEUX|nr:GntR family transcriptional regulator [Pseudonocardia dioxanivorans]AEA27187.1 transcriptional regulator, GntR family [Pseudonocardia dioxanivorans CB1190]GJF07190.1 GntR family transcriptional regulator [Pseudonocardia sp. D17]